MFKEFKEFAIKGNVIDMAVGIIIGASFGGIVKSLVDDLIMPPLGLIIGKIDFSNLYLLLHQGSKAPGPYSSLAEAKAAGAVTLNYGVFVNQIVSFTIVAFAVFLLVRFLNRLKRKEGIPPQTKVCEFCASSIPISAIRCPHCTSELKASPSA